MFLDDEKLRVIVVLCDGQNKNTATHQTLENII